MKGPLAPLSAEEKQIEAELSRHVWTLSSAIGARSLTSAPDNLEKAAIYIEQEFRKRPVYKIEKQEFTADALVMSGRQVKNDGIVFPSKSYQTRNIIAEKPGVRHPDRILIVGAHYDSVYDCPAANDNGSGVASLLELSRLLADEQLDCTVRFVAFTNEEPPYFRTDKMGSHVYCESIYERGDKLIGMICLETMGYYSDEPDSQSLPHALFKAVYPTTGNFIAFISNFHSRHFLGRSARAFEAGVEFPFECVVLPQFIAGVDFSDQHAFWQRGYPAFMVTDTAFYRYPHYHELQDTADKVDCARLARVVAGLTHTIRSLSKS